MNGNELCSLDWKLDLEYAINQIDGLYPVRSMNGAGLMKQDFPAFPSFCSQLMHLKFCSWGSGDPNGPHTRLNGVAAIGGGIGGRNSLSMPIGMSAGCAVGSWG